MEIIVAALIVSACGLWLAHYLRQMRDEIRQDIRELAAAMRLAGATAGDDEPDTEEEMPLTMGQRVLAELARREREIV